MDDLLNEFIAECEEKGITIYHGSIPENDQTTVLLHEPKELIQYCEQFELKALFIEAQYAKREEKPVIDQDVIIEKITKYFQKKKQEYPYSSIRFAQTQNNLPLDYYDDVLSQVISEIKKDPDIAKLEQMAQSENNFQPEEVLVCYTCFVLYHGFIISSLIIPNEEDENPDDNSGEDYKTEKEILNKYADRILSFLTDYYQKADEESKRIRKEKEDAVIREIEKTVKNNSSVLSMKTQKARNEYADRLYAVWYREKGHDWLTKTAVRSIVDLQYVYLTGGMNSDSQLTL